MLNAIAPLIAIGYFLFFIKNNKLNPPLVGLIFLSFLFFATNYSHYGLEVDIYRYLHRFIGAIIAVSLVVKIIKQKIPIYKDPVAILLSLFLMVLLLSSVGNDLNLPHYTHYVRNFIFIGCIVMYLYLQLDSEDKLGELYRLVIGLTAILAFFVLIEVFQSEWSRTQLFYSNPNYLGYALLPGFILSIYSKIKYKWFFVVSILIAIFATGSNSAEIGVIFAILTLAISHRNQINKVHIFIASVLVVVFGMFFNKIVLNLDINSTRYALSKIAINAFEENPVNGIGYGQFRTKLINYIDNDVLSLDNHEINDVVLSYDNSLSDKYLRSRGIDRYLEKMTHSDLLTIISELGLLGVLFVFWVFYRLYFSLKRIKLNCNNAYFLSISLIGASLLFSLFHNNLTSFVFWFVLLLPFIIIRNIEKTQL